MYLVGDLHNGVLEEYASEREAREALRDLIIEGTVLNIEYGDDPETARERAQNFYFMVEEEEV